MGWAARTGPRATGTTWIYTYHQADRMLRRDRNAGADRDIITYNPQGRPGWR